MSININRKGGANVKNGTTRERKSGETILYRPRLVDFSDAVYAGEAGDELKLEYYGTSSQKERGYANERKTSAEVNRRIKASKVGRKILSLANI